MSAAQNYVISAAVLAAASIVLLFRSRSGEIARRAAAGAGVSALWAAILAGQSSFGTGLAWVNLLAEGLRYTAWLAALRVMGPPASPRWLGKVYLFICLAPVGYALAGWIGRYTGSFALPLESVYDFAGLALAVVGLVATEQTVRLTPGKLSRELRLALVGLGGMFAYDLFLFSQAQLLGGLHDSTWAARGLVSAALVVPFAMGVWRLPGVLPRVFVSRHVVYYSSALFAVGVYLSLMALGGYYVRENGGSWGSALQVLFFCGAAALLARVLLSESPFRRLRVFISTHFYRNKYDYRITWLRFIDTLSSDAGDDVRRTAVRAVSQVIGSPGGVLFMPDEQGRVFVPVAAWPLSPDSIPGLSSVDAGSDMIGFIRERHWIIDLPEYRRSPEIYRHIALPAWFDANPELTLVTPLLELDRLAGFFVLYQPPPPFSLTFEDRDLLNTAGRHVATQLAQHDAARRLAESRQFEAYNRLTAFMMHDLKNSVAQLGLVVANAQRHKRNPEFVDDAIGTIGNAVERMTRLIEQLRDPPRASAAQSVDIAKLLEVAVARCAVRPPLPELAVPDSALCVRADPERLVAVLEHVIRNAQDAAPEGRVSVTLDAQDGEARLSVRDTGAGMHPEFVRERLFRPFDSTKGSKGMGIGAYQAREYVQSLGGRVEVQSSPGAGTTFSIILPAAKATATRVALME